MSMTPIRKVVAVTGTYVKDGQEKKRYTNVGTLFKDSDDGRIAIKLDSIPVGPEFSGWLNCYELDDRQATPAPAAAPAPAPAPEIAEEDIPF